MSRPLHVEAELSLAPLPDPAQPEAPSRAGSDAAVSGAGHPPGGSGAGESVTLRGGGRTLRLPAPTASHLKRWAGFLPLQGSPLGLLRRVVPWLARGDLRLEVRAGDRLLLALDPQTRPLVGRVLRIPGLRVHLGSLATAAGLAAGMSRRLERGTQGG